MIPAALNLLPRSIGESDPGSPPQCAIRLRSDGYPGCHTLVNKACTHMRILLTSSCVICITQMSSDSVAESIHVISRSIDERSPSWISPQFLRLLLHPLYTGMCGTGARGPEQLSRLWLNITLRYLDECPFVVVWQRCRHLLLHTALTSGAACAASVRRFTPRCCAASAIV